MPQVRRKGAFALTFFLFAPLAVFSQQQQQQQSRQQNEVSQQQKLQHAQEGSLLDAFTSQGIIASDVPIHHDHEITHEHKHGKHTALIPNQARAVVTYAPAERQPAVRAPPAKAAGPAGDISSVAARSLRDWEAEQFVLLATIDGKIHARDRRTGMKEYWTFPPPGEEKPMVQTINRRLNESSPHPLHHADERLWIVEPTEDGQLYVYMPGAQAGLLKLPATISQMVRDAPYADDDPPVMYTASKKSTIYKLNARSGQIISKLSAGGDNLNDSCRHRPGLNKFEGEECKGDTLIIARTEYTVEIHDQRNGQESTIIYNQWTPNNRDTDLLRQYSESMDRKYFYSKYNGHLLAVDHAGDGESAGSSKPKGISHFSSPVVRIFDVARPLNGQQQDDVSLMILPQPTRLLDELEKNRSDDDLQRIFVNHTESLGWWAMSEVSYPYSSSGAPRAECTNEWAQDLFQYSGGLPPPSALVGMHTLVSDSHDRRQAIPRIDAPKDVQYSGNLADEVNYTGERRVAKIQYPSLQANNTAVS